jgi:ATP-dependent DNA helicase RecG
MAAPTGVNIALLTGRDKGKAREGILMGLMDGSIDMVVGTHAIFQDAVAYKNLALAVIDEQHRFGVGQRLMLTQKGKATPHCLAMTATPIPRTLTWRNMARWMCRGWTNCRRAVRPSTRAWWRRSGSAMWSPR